MEDDPEAAEWRARRSRREYGVVAILLGVASVVLFVSALLGRHEVSGAFGVLAVMSGSLGGMWIKARRQRHRLSAAPRPDRR